MMGEKYGSLSCYSCSFLRPPVTSSVLGPYILLSTLFSNTLSLRSSLNVSDQVSHPYKTKGKIAVPYISFFIGMSLVRFQMVSLEFFSDPIALWPWGRLSL